MILGIFGAGGFGREVLECIKQIQMVEKKWSEIFFIDDYTENKIVNGVTVLRYKEFKEKYKSKKAKIFIAIGEPENRRKLYEIIKTDGYELETIINTNVWIPDTTTIGEGCFIGYGAFISCNITIGDNSLVMPYASIGHDTIVGNHCVCSDQSNIAGNCVIKDCCFLGLNSIIKEELILSEWTIVSAGSAVLRDVEEENWIVAGVPARKMQRNTEHTVFK